MTQFTQRFKFPIPDFAVKPWHAALLTTFARVDEAMFHALINAGLIPWGNSVVFEAGQVAVDTTTGTFWICLIDHTSAASGTFSDDRDDNPTYWGLSTTAPESRGAWTTATAYANTDFVSYNNGFYICVITHTSTTFETDLAAGKWDTLIDLAPIIESINASLVGIEEFLVIYLGAKASDPLLDNDGNALINGAMYFNTVSNVLKVYSIGPGWTSITTSAPNNADYLVKTADAALAAERVVSDGAAAGKVNFDWSVAGTVKAFLYATAADKMLYTTAANAWAETTLSVYARTLLDDTTAAAARTTLGVGTVGTLNYPGTLTTYLRGDGNFVTLSLGSIATINLSGSTGQVLRGDGNWTTFGNVGSYTFPGGTSFLRADGNWVVPTDTNSGGTLTGASQGVTTSGTTVIMNTNNYFGVGSYSFVLANENVGAGATFSSSSGGTWRNMTANATWANEALPIGGTLAIRVA